MRYENPILQGFHADPSICRVGEDYYLVVSSFEFFPGLPIYHSRDLVNWTQIGHCVQQAEEFPLINVGDSGGVWAPTIRWHEGVFYVTATLEKFGNFIVTATDPAGEWSSPVWLPEIGGIDPSLLFDAGRVYYCTNDQLVPGEEGICLQEIDVSTGRITSSRKMIWSGVGAHFIEAPHIYHIGDWYYLIVAEGGTFFNHMITAARSRDIWGPYESCPHNPILTNIGDTTWQVQCSGHGDLVEDGQGHWWMVHLGIRLARRTMTHLGRETFLTPVCWEDGWPLCGTDRKAALVCDGPLAAPQQPLVPFVADMSRTTWEPQWVFLRRPNMADHQRVPGAMLLCPTTRTLADSTSTFAAMPPHGFDCVTETTFTFDAQRPGDEAGLVVRLDSKFHITCLRNHESKLVLTLHADEIHHIVAEAALVSPCIHLQLLASKERFDFFWAEEGGEFQPLGHVSTRFLSTGLSGRCFTGVYIGLHAACREETAAMMRVTEFNMHI